MTTAIVEFDPLSDPIGTRPKNHRLRSIIWFRLADLLVRAVQVGRERFEFGGTRVDSLIDRCQPRLTAEIGDEGYLTPEYAGQFLIAEAGALEDTKEFPWHLTQTDRCRGTFQLDDLGELGEEPAVDMGQFVDLLHTPTAIQGTEHGEHPSVCGHHELLL